MTAVTDVDASADTGVPADVELLAFATAAQQGGDDLPEAWDRLIGAVGRDGAVEAAATVAAFNGLVRVADGTGIRLDAGLASYSADVRAELGIDGFTGAANGAEGADPTADGSDVMGLFR